MTDLNGQGVQTRTPRPPLRRVRSPSGVCTARMRRITPCPAAAGMASCCRWEVFEHRAPITIHVPSAPYTCMISC